MAFINRADNDLSKLDRESKIIKSYDASAYAEGKDILEKARIRQREIITAAEEFFEAEQRRGYHDGREAARIEQSSDMIGIVGQTVEYFSNIEHKLVELVMQAIQRIIDDYTDEEKIIRVVQTALVAAKTQKYLQLYVHPENMNYVQNEISKLKEKFSGIEQIDVNPNSELKKDACIVQSEIGKIEASLSGQISALQSSLSKVFGKDSNEDI